MNENLQPNLEAVEKALKSEKQRITRNMFHLATPAHGIKSRGVGITRKSKEESKKAKKLAKLQRKTNHKIANKKHHKTGSNKRK